MSMRLPSATITRLTALAALLTFALQGFHLEFRQASAWIQMAFTYSEGSNIVTALNQTFSGDRPCEHCTSIAQERVGSSEAPDLLTPPPPDDPLSIASTGNALHDLRAPRRAALPLFHTRRLPSNRLRPPTPPPRMDFS